jgi:tRNA A37 threonylcarbamoyladenosine modification protein TsaB
LLRGLVYQAELILQIIRMKIEIEIENNQITIFLKSKREILDELSFPEARDLSQKLLPNIDRLLKKNGISPGKIEKIELKSDIGEPYTTYRIAKAVAKTFNWSVKKHK